MSATFSSRKAKITKDWAALCPLFKVWKPKHLLRLHGPLIMGICLDAVRAPDSYQPFFHFHNLAVPSNVMTLSPAGPLLTPNGSYDRIKLARHDAELADIFERFSNQYPLVTRDRLGFSDYLRTASDSLRGRYGGCCRPHVYRDIILAAGYCGAIEWAHEELKVFCRDLLGRSDFNMQIIGSVEKWSESIGDVLDKATLGGIVSEQKDFHRLDAFEDYGLDFDTSTRLFDLP